MKLSHTVNIELIAVLSAAFAMSIAIPAFGQVAQERASVTTTTMPAGQAEVIQRIDSRMEPTAVQMRHMRDPVTGELTRVVEPIIMERHDRLLDTTIMQPAVTETTRVRENMRASRAVSSSERRVVSKRVAVRPIVRPRRIAYGTARTRALISSKEYMRTTESTRQPVMQQTIIKNTDIEPAPEPQVIQKIDTERGPF